MNQKELKEFIVQLCALGERQFQQETKACQLIEASLKRAGVAYVKENFHTWLPLFKKTQLVADGRNIPCAASSFVSGTIENANHLISSLTSSQNFLFTGSINFNPACESISRSNHYFAPSLAVSKTYVPALCSAKKVHGQVEVEKKAHISANLLVGNTKSPRYLVFSHYDSIFSGAVDNASGTALSLCLAINYPKLLKKTLFVFAGNEELSYNKPIYWGHGYRVFENKHYPLLAKAKKILILDSLGYSETYFIQEPFEVILGFPIKHMRKLQKKLYLVIGDMQQLMKFYHSDLDVPDLVKTSELMRAAEKVINALSMMPGTCMEERERQDNA